MKNHAFLSFFLSLLFFSAYSYGQNFEVPQTYEFVVKEDYAKYHEQIVAAVNWLESTPLDQEPDKRKKVNAFLFQWISGSPDVSVELQEYVNTFSEKNPQLLLVFLGGWARYQLQHPAEKDRIRFHMAGIETVLKAYEQGGARKDKDIEKLLKYRKKEKLENWLKKKVG
jgi:hypothetical protein